MAASSAQVEDTIKRISSHKGVEGIIVVSHDGVPIRTTLQPAVTVQYAALVSMFTHKSQSIVKQIDPMDNLIFLRIRSKKHEIMVAPDENYVLIVVQKPSVG